MGVKQSAKNANSTYKIIKGEGGVGTLGQIKIKCAMFLKGYKKLPNVFEIAHKLKLTFKFAKQTVRRSSRGGLDR